MAALLGMVAMAVNGSPVEWQAGETVVKVEFFTPSIVHVVKEQPTKTLVITVKPENVAVTQKDNTWKSSELTVKLELRDGGTLP